MLSADSVKEVGNAKITTIQKARACTVIIPLGLIVVGHLSVADLLNLVVLLGVPIQKNDDFTVQSRSHDCEC